MRQRRIVHISKSFEEAKKWDIYQDISMTPDQRLRASRSLNLRIYGRRRPDVRAACKKA